MYTQCIKLPEGNLNPYTLRTAQK